MGICEVLRGEEVKEYTLLALASTLLVMLLDVAVLKTRLMKQLRFWAFIAVMFAFKLIVNGYLTWRPIVLYNEEFFLAKRLVTIPIEDFFYGFSLISLAVILWEFFQQNADR